MPNVEPQSEVAEFFKIYRVYQQLASKRRDEWNNQYDGSNVSYESRVMIEFQIDLLKRVDNLEKVLNVNKAEIEALRAELDAKS